MRAEEIAEMLRLPLFEGVAPAHAKCDAEGVFSATVSRARRTGARGLSRPIFCMSLSMGRSRSILPIRDRETTVAVIGPGHSFHRRGGHPRSHFI